MIKLIIMMIILNAPLVAGAYDDPCPRMLEKIILTYTKNRENLVNQKFKRVAMASRISPTEARKLTTEDKANILGLFGIPIYASDAVSGQVIRNPASNAIPKRAKTFKLLLSNDFDIMESYRLSQDHPKKAQQAIDMFNNRRESSAENKDQLNKSLLDLLKSNNGKKFYESRVWSIISQDYSDPIAAGLKIILDSAMDSRLVSKSVKEKVDSIENMIIQKMYYAIESLPLLTRGQKDFLRRYLGISAAIQATCSGGEYLRILGDMAKNIDRTISSTKDAAHAIHDLKDQNWDNIKKSSNEIIHSNKKLVEAHGILFEEIEDTLISIPDGVTVNTCALVTNQELGNLMESSGASEFTKNIAAASKTFLLKDFKDLMNSTKNHLSKNQCTDFLKEQGKKGMDLFSKMLILNATEKAVGK